MREISLHLLDIAENSIAACSKNIQVLVCEDFSLNQLLARVIDDGKGMDEETVLKVADPFVTSRNTRKVGLGIPLLKAAAESCNGYLNITSELAKGTTVEVAFQHDHIDRMPLGDLAGTFITLLVAYPPVHWFFEYKCIPPLVSTPSSKFQFDDANLKNELPDVSLTEPDVLRYLRNWIESGISNVHQDIQEYISDKWRVSIKE
jgi:hypothetical protein